MVVIKFLKCAINAINSQMSQFLWGNLGDQHKYHLANWCLVSRKKTFGGLGVPNLKDLNMALLASWGKHVFDNMTVIGREFCPLNVMLTLLTFLGSREKEVLIIGAVLSRPYRPLKHFMVGKLGMVTTSVFCIMRGMGIIP